MTTAHYFRDLIYRDPNTIGLARAALEIAKIQYPTLDAEPYLLHLKNMAHEISKRLKAISKSTDIVDAISNYLFLEIGYTGNDKDYYNIQNSCLNCVIDLKTGIPITLSIIYLEVAWNLGVPLRGISFPGQFIVGQFDTSEPRFVDPFSGGVKLSKSDLKQILVKYGLGPLPLENVLIPCNKKEILSRMLRNLKAIYLGQKNLGRTKACIDRLLVLSPDDNGELRDRGLIFHQLKKYTEARADLLTYIRRCPNNSDVAVIEELLSSNEYHRIRLH